ncbi:SDR family oxidoreductase [Glycomyces tritici]|uniref:SDR family oxidoreductase n=1 Tax=Glycomyces tritici TaxID=2665176 RepID=A0ABT7YUI7_9ACTN|nr:SDR family oxidoreductase [Glycomyces tritici]MDN3241463.1 SDR family oxidoreductase [Glycomyces tritici]MDN3242250.1 SDR family oxidoreductase [Glycomyces tritici]
METIAVTGATGQLGSRVARMLAERGVRQRLVVRDPSRAPELDGAEVKVASFEDEPALRAALSGVQTLFMVSAHESRDRMPEHRSAVRAAVAAGVERVVYTSFMGASPQATFTFAREHSLTERLIAESGLRLTALRNSLYADMLPLFVQDGVIRGPAGQGRVAWVARHDVARLAVEALLDPAHADRVYDVSGPEPLDLHESARILSAVTGREIAYVPETDEEARASRAGAEDWQIAGWAGSYQALATGETSVTSHSIEHVTGRRPWGLEEFLRSEPESWRHLAA